MIRPFGMVFFISLLVLFSAVPTSSAGECAYGSVDAWFRTSNTDWENATAHPILKRGESFEMKILVRIKTDLRVVYVTLHEFGTPVFEVITGPSTMEQLLEHWGLTDSDQPMIYVWKMRVRVNTTWVNAYSPLELFVQFTKDDDDDSSVSFDVMNAFVIDELWENYSQEPPNESNSSQRKDALRLSSVSITTGIIIVFFIGVFLRVRWQRKKFF
jgi:sarcinarray family protein